MNDQGRWGGTTPPSRRSARRGRHFSSDAEWQPAFRPVSRYDSSMSDLATWLGVAIAVVALGVAYITYKSGRNRRRLEYVVETRTPLIPRPVVGSMEVRFDGQVVPNPALTVIRVVNTGDKAIPADSYESDLGFSLTGAQIAAATLTSTRPSDLRPNLTTSGDTVLVEPKLLNPGDMLVIQILSSELPTAVRAIGRISDVPTITVRRSLPYPPGSGPEGEMIAFDRFMWYAFTPAILLGGFVGIPLTFPVDAITRGIWAAVGILATGIYLTIVRRLVVRRRRWRAEPPPPAAGGAP